ncbi:porin family protein [Emticicia sp. W12TSBA100-4]|uniref:porin family protein n=1 Tax=Emticicia sp. W12TSBA100-4 TaxID=3160965 RepID=UPI00330615B0
MRNRIIITAFIAVLGIFKTINADAQKARSGIKGGLNASNLYIDDINDRNPRYGFNVGLFTQVPLIEGTLYLQPEIGYSTKGTTARYNILNTFQGETTFKLDYAEVPLLLTYKIGNVIDIQAGAYGGYLVNASSKSKADNGSSSEVLLNKDNYRNFDYGLSAGLNIYFGKLMVGTRYNHGLQQIANTDAARTFLGDSKNSVGQVHIGITF